MRLLIQRVKQAQVTVAGESVGAIGKGLLVFLGIHKGDTEESVGWLVSKLAALRIFADEQGKMNHSLKDIGGELLIVSQFTLYGDCNNGRRPDFIDAMSGSEAEVLYRQFISEAEREIDRKVATGVFGAYMEVSLINDGPVTFLLERESAIQ